MRKQWWSWWWMLFGWVSLAGIGMAAVPAGILVLDGKDGEREARIEFTGGAEAFLWWSGKLYPGSASESGGAVRLKFPAGKSGGKGIALTLVPRGEEWVDGEGDRWQRRERVLKRDPSWTPVKVRVTDQHGKGLGKFSYSYRVEWKGGSWDPLLVRALTGGDETIELLAPKECMIHLEVNHPDCVRGYGSGLELDRKKGAVSLPAEVRRGRTVTGRVIRDSSGESVAGVLVSPLIFTPPLFSPDRERSVVTGVDGAFELRGVDHSFGVEHPDYLDEEIWLEENMDGPLVVRLKSGATIRGVVRDPEGKTLGGVEVEDGTGKSVTTGGDGVFVLRGLRKWSGENWWLDFSKEGFNEHDFRGTKIGPEGLEIELVPLPELRGRVVLADGAPVRNYRIVCGPGASPASYECVEVAVADEDGRFVFRPESLPEEGDRFWIGIRADGAAPWDGVVPLDRLRGGEYRVELGVGVALIATLELPESATGVVAVSLEANDRQSEEQVIVSTHPGKELASDAWTLPRGEALRVPHLRVGEYVLRIRCAGATPINRAVTMGDSDRDLGVLRLRGTGSISGVVRDPYASVEPWRFEAGRVHVEGTSSDPWEPYLRFNTDGAGEFRVDGVPVGVVSVSFPYNMSADIIGSMSREVRVLEGRETVVRLEGEGGAWARPLRLMFDGQAEVPVYQGTRKVDNVTDCAPMFRFEVTPVGAGPVSWGDSVEWDADGEAGPVIPDLAPGHWKIRVYDWLGSRGFVEGLRVEVVAEVGDQRDPVKVALGGNALSGRVTSARETRRLVRIVAVGATSRRVFLSRCDGEGDFVVRYLPADDYRVHAHDDDGGWCDLGVHTLNQAVVDCGEHALLEGGHVTGTIAGGLRIPKLEDQLRAIGPDGVEVPVDEVEEDGSYRFGNLMPGKWTILLRIDDREIFRHPVEVRKGTVSPVTATGDGP